MTGSPFGMSGCNLLFHGDCDDDWPNWLSISHPDRTTEVKAQPYDAIAIEFKKETQNNDESSTTGGGCHGDCRSGTQTRIQSPADQRYYYFILGCPDEKERAVARRVRDFAAKEVEMPRDHRLGARIARRKRHPA